MSLAILAIISWGLVSSYEYSFFDHLMYIMNMNMNMMLNNTTKHHLHHILSSFDVYYEYDA